MDATPQPDQYECHNCQQSILGPGAQAKIEADNNTQILARQRREELKRRPGESLSALILRTQRANQLTR